MFDFLPPSTVLVTHKQASGAALINEIHVTSTAPGKCLLITRQILVAPKVSYGDHYFAQSYILFQELITYLQYKFVQ
jgi:hypothetical protein